jgi:molecular chaperone IbpA
MDAHQGSVQASGHSAQPVGEPPRFAANAPRYCSLEDISMRTFDLSPLFRASVGFDNLARVFDAATRLDESHFSYPPYNIAKAGEDAYRITFAVAGFGEKDLDVNVENNTLTVRGRVAPEDDKNAYLYRGIAGRSFERKFELANHIQVEGARFENGLLHIDLKRVVPEALKPRKIAISGPAPVQSTIAHAA